MDEWMNLDRQVQKLWQQVLNRSILTSVWHFIHFILVHWIKCFSTVIFACFCEIISLVYCYRWDLNQRLLCNSNVALSTRPTCRVTSLFINNLSAVGVQRVYLYPNTKVLNRHLENKLGDSTLSSVGRAPIRYKRFKFCSVGTKKFVSCSTFVLIVISFYVE